MGGLVEAFKQGNKLLCFQSEVLVTGNNSRKLLGLV